MTAALDNALRAALAEIWPPPGFAESLLEALRDASVTPLQAVEVADAGSHRWLVAGTVAAGAAGVAGVTFFGVRRLRRGRAA